MFSGKIWSAKRAKELGLIDDIGLLELVLKTTYGPKFTLIRITAPKTLMSYIKSMIGIEFGLQSITDALVQSVAKYFVKSDELPFQLKMK